MILAIFHDVAKPGIIIPKKKSDMNRLKKNPGTIFSKHVLGAYLNTPRGFESNLGPKVFSSCSCLTFFAIHGWTLLEEHTYSLVIYCSSFMPAGCLEPIWIAGCVSRGNLHQCHRFCDVPLQIQAAQGQYSYAKGSMTLMSKGCNNGAQPVPIFRATA